MEISQMTPRRPYLLRAFYDWLLENQLTPHLVVNVTHPNVKVPMDFAENGQIVLNIAPRAVGNLQLGDEAIIFNARFGGVSQQVWVPMAAVMAIYARENGAGTLFEPEAAYEHDSASKETKPLPETLENTMSVIESSSAKSEADQDPSDDPPPASKRPTLRIVK